MMNNSRFRRTEPMRKTIQCSCGSSSKLMKRRNFSHGRKSGGKSYRLYKCVSCGKELSLIKTREAK